MRMAGLGRTDMSPQSAACERVPIRHWLHTVHESLLKQPPSRAASCSWCDRPFQLRQSGGHAQRFCRPTCRRQFRDAGRFLDNGFAAQAAALDWDALELFGCDANRPYARIDNAGLICFLNGDRLVVLTELSARIETKSGATLTYYRKPGELGRALAWELDQMSQRPILTRNTENE
jgi:hypothetical protein